MNSKKRILNTIILTTIILTGLFFPVSLHAHEPIGSVYREYVRVLALLGKSEWRPRSFNTFSDARDLGSTITTDHLWSDRIGPRDPVDEKAPANEKALEVRILDPELRASVNTHVPHNRNNESQWEGRGFNTLLRGGAALNHGGLSAVLAPEISFAQNASFATIGEPTTDYGPALDRPQRFGTDPFFTIHPGQSSLRYRRWNAVLGVATDNIWLGPARDNAIVLSDNAPGFARVELGTAEPAETRFGRFEAVTWWGALPRSEYFESDLDPDYLFKLGYSLGYAPPVLEGLYLGFNRSYLSPLETIDGFKVFQHGDTFFKSDRREFNGEDDINQVASVTAHWFLPGAGFEVYLEWARWDHTSNINDFMRNPEHAAAYTLGFQKAVDLTSFYLVLEGEVTRVGNNETTTVGAPRPTYPIYRHNAAPGGYTNDGQILGAWIGTGSNAQLLGARAYFPWGLVHARLQRLAYDNDYYFRFFPGTPSRKGYDARLLSTLGTTLFLDRFDLGAEYTFHRLWNWNWDESSPEFNSTLAFSLRYHL